MQEKMFDEARISAAEAQRVFILVLDDNLQARPAQASDVAPYTIKIGILAQLFACCTQST